MPNPTPVTTGLDPKAYLITEPTRKVKSFLDFCSKNIESAISELKNIDVNNRTHLQKLVYTNLVDRFERLIVDLTIWSGTHNQKVRDILFEKMSNDPIPKKEAFRLLYMGEGVRSIIEDEILKTANEVILRESHWQKVQRIMESVDWKRKDAPRVNNNNGRILGSVARHDKYPNNIYGYADWLYIRRNCIVHGEGVRYDESIRSRFKKMYKVNLPLRTSLSIASVKNALTFYKGFCSEYLSELERCLRENKID